MERSPERDYIDANRHTLLGLLDAGEEIDLFVTPTAAASIRGEDELSAHYLGQPVESYDPQTFDGVDARHFAKMAQASAYTFRTRLHMTLVSRMFEENVGEIEANSGQRSTAETEAIIEEAMQGLQASIDAVLVSTERTELIDNETDVRYAITATRAVDPEGIILGREIEIETEDGVVQKSVQVSQYDTGAHARLEVNQSLRPASDEAIQQISEYFLGQHDDKESFAAMMGVFGEGMVRLVDPAAPENEEHTRRLQHMYARYTDDQSRQKIEDFISIMQGKVEDYKNQHAMMRDFPGFDLPTFAELQTYRQLLDAIRS